MFEYPRDRRNFMANVAREYGDLAQFSIGNLKFYQNIHPDGVRQVLLDNYRNYERGKMMDPLRNLVGNGLIFSDGDYWQQQRGLMQPAFHQQFIANFSEMVTGEANALADHWQTHASQGQSFDASQDLFNLTMRVTTRAVLSAENPEDQNAIRRAMITVIENIGYRFEMPFYPPVSVPTPRNRRLSQALQTFDNVLFRYVEEWRRKSQMNGGWGNDLLGMFMAARLPGDGQGMSDQELRNETITMFTTGPEPTSIALAWAFYFLSKYPEVQEQLSVELGQVLRGRLPTIADLPNLVYTRLVLEESLRLFPPAWLVTRTAIAEDEILGYEIPAGVVIMMSPYLTHRHIDFWEDPEKFDPERFRPSRAAGRSPYAYFPFGVGPHQCIGRDFAMLQEQLALATLAQRFRLEVLPDERIEVLSGLMLRPSQLPVHVVPLS
jgi:cytochrome P450